MARPMPQPQQDLNPNNLNMQNEKSLEVFMKKRRVNAVVQIIGSKYFFIEVMAILVLSTEMLVNRTNLCKFL